MVEGLAALNVDRSLRDIAFSSAAMSWAYGIVGTVYALYALRELGFPTGPLGLVYAVGGVSSLAASVLAGRINQRLGVGPAMIIGLLLGAGGLVFLPLARGAGVVAYLLLIAQQLVGDGGLTLYGINQMSVRQAIAPAASLGRINAGSHAGAVGATLFGVLVAGALGQTIGLRLTLVLGAVGMLAGALVLLRSPVASLRAA